MLEFFDINKKSGNASIYSSFITLNKTLADCLVDAYRVRVAVSKGEKKIYLFKLTKDRALSGEYDLDSLLKVGISKTYARICSKQMMDFILGAFNIKVEAKNFIRATATYNIEKEAVIIDLGEVI